LGGENRGVAPTERKKEPIIVNRTVPVFMGFEGQKLGPFRMSTNGTETTKAPQALRVTRLSLLALFLIGGVQIHSPRPILSQKVEFILRSGLETEVERLSVFSQLTARANHRLLPAEFLRTRELG